MTGKDEHTIYPQYCFPLSPTINTYCPLQSSDIECLWKPEGFRGQDVFFHLNHPIKWVRIAGVVVAVDEFPQRRIYTIDDSNGVCIECVVQVPKPDTTRPEAEEPKTTVPNVPEGVDVGTVLDVKGGLTLFRGNKQVRMVKATVIRSTEQEVAFWEKVRQFRGDVLGKPWKLTDKEVRRCRKEEERQR